MINENKWISSLPKTHVELHTTKNQINHSRWINTISKKNTYNVVGKYTFMTVLFVCGLLFVSAIKNETRNLEKDINNLKATNNAIKFNLDQAILDNEVVISPENISRLAKEYLDTDFIPYKKSQIIKLGEDNADLAKKVEKKNNLSKKIKLKITKKIEIKKKEIKKLQEIYSKPQSIPSEIKTQVAKKIQEKKIELKNLYDSPNETIDIVKAKRWVAVQVVKVFLGIPIIPGR